MFTRQRTHKFPLGLLNLKGSYTNAFSDIKRAPTLNSWQPYCLCVFYLGQQQTASKVCRSKQEVTALLLSSHSELSCGNNGRCGIFTAPLASAPVSFSALLLWFKQPSCRNCRLLVYSSLCSAIGPSLRERRRLEYFGAITTKVRLDRDDLTDFHT